MAEYAGDLSKKGEDEPARLDQSKGKSSEVEPARLDQNKGKSSEVELERWNQDMGELEAGSSTAEFTGTKRRRVEVEQARWNQDMIKLAAESAYDVFLSFRECDSIGFTDSICHRLKARGIRVFKYDGNPGDSEELPLSLSSSKIYIPIFSVHYANSTRCLNVLELMVEHTSRSGGEKDILPVLYDVERSDLNMENKSLYGDALDSHRLWFGADKVDKWEKAVVEAGNVEGWERKSHVSEEGLITSIVTEILLKLKVEEVSIGDGTVLSYRTLATRRWSQIRLVVTFLCFLFRLRRIRNKVYCCILSLDEMHGMNSCVGGTSVEAHTKRTFERMASSSGTYSISAPLFSTVLSSGTYSNSELEDSQVSKIISLLAMDVNGIRVVGIHGRDGIGKTALAKAVYNKISVHFDTCSFLAEIEETVRHPGGVQCLQTKLIFDILKREYEVASAFKGVRFLKEILRNMKVLLVLDDLENGCLLKGFVGLKLDWFGSGSRIIVTSKQRSVLQGFVDQGVACTYDVLPMDDRRAFSLFCQCAIGMTDDPHEPHPYFNYETVHEMVKAAEGLPLLIKVFGSFFHGKRREEWIKFRYLMGQFPQDYQKILSIIYEALDPKQKQMYLDIARFLPDVDCRIASYMWHDYDRPGDGIEVLRRMSLIKMEENKIGMHSMLRCLARKVIYDGFHDAGTRVRFYIPVIAHDTKKRKRGADHLNTIMAGYEILPSTTFLSVGHTNIGGRFADALLNVRWLHWQGCPPDFEANSIYLENLVILDLSWSKVTGSWGGWKGIKMERLKVLNLTGCADLLITPNFSCYPRLEMLILERCSRLVHLDPSINELKLLVTLNLKFCSELNMLPVEMEGTHALRELLIDGTSIRELPESIGKLALLQILSATNCFSLVRIPGSVCELELLSVLALDEAKILELPESFGNLWGLTRLSLSDCRGLGKLPESIGELEDLVELDISGTGISKLPDSTENMRSLKVLKMDSCFLREFPRGIGALINLEEVHASWCRSLEGDIPSDISKLHRLRELRLRGTRISSLPLEIQSMSSLQTLDLLYCELLKKLPPLPSGLIDLHVNPNLKQ